MADLWPDDFGSLKVTPPIQVLREQASFLSTKTGGKVTGEVSTGRQGLDFKHDFFIIAPYLDGYAYLLFSVTHSLSLYPLTFRALIIDQTYECKSFEDFENVLKKVLSTEQTKKVISAMIAQTDAVRA